MGALRLTLRQLQIFAAIAQDGTTVAAGASLGLSQSATSAALNELERLLSMELFDRAGKRLLLNDNGRQLLPRALAMLDGAAEIEGLSDGSTARQFSLKIGASTTIGNYVLPRLLSSYFGRWEPDPAHAWQSRVVIGNTAEIAEAVASFALDVGLIEGPCHLAEVDSQPWMSDDLVVVASPAIGASLSPAPGMRVPIKVLREQVWLLRETGSGTRAVTDSALLPHLRSFRRSIEFGSSEAIKHAASEGMGLACLSAWVVADWVASQRIVRVDTTLPPMTRQCFIVIHRNKRRTEGLDRFLRHLQATAKLTSLR